LLILLHLFVFQWKGKITTTPFADWCDKSVVAKGGKNDKSSISFMENERPKNLHIAFLGDSVTRYQVCFHLLCASFFNSNVV
jgi:hypothetical protein